MAKKNCNQQVEGVAAPLQIQQQNASVDCDLLCYYETAIELFGGSNSGLRVGVLTGGGADALIEITGDLPQKLRVGLRRVYAWWECPRRGKAPWQGIIWQVSRGGYGPRYRIVSPGMLFDLVADRRLALQGG